MNTTEVLIKAKALIADERYWSQGSVMRTEHDESGYCRVSYCAGGAVMRVLDRLHDRYRVDHPAIHRLAATALLTDIERECIAFAHEKNAAMWMVITYNDRPKTEHQDVLAWFDRAIALAHDPMIMVEVRPLSELAVEPEPELAAEPEYEPLPPALDHHMQEALAALLTQAGLTPAAPIVEDVAREPQRELEPA